MQTTSTEIEVIPYSNIEAEQAILGMIIMNNAHLPTVSDFLEPRHFAIPQHAKIYKYILRLSAEIELVDQVTLIDFFRIERSMQDIGGVQYLYNIVSRASLIVRARIYANMLVELWQKRELAKLLQLSILSLEKSKFEHIKSQLENDIAGLILKDSKKKTKHVNEILKDLEEEALTGKETKFVSSGFDLLDKKLNGGFYAGQLVILGARPSIGKTSWAQNIIINASKKGARCLFLSLEVDNRNVILKFISNLASVPTWKVSRGSLNQVEHEAVVQAKNKLKELNIYTNDSSNLKIADIENIIKNEIAKNPVDLVVVDYVQYIRYQDDRNKNESWLIKENTTALKTMAKKYNVAMLALAQVNRKAVEGADQEPTINDFKGSGGIEEDADVAMILHRNRLDKEEKTKNYFSNTAKLIIAKNRHGQTGEINLRFDGDFGRFLEESF